MNSCVDISNLTDIYLGNISLLGRMEPQSVEYIFEGTDLRYNPENGSLYPRDGVGEPLTFNDLNKELYRLWDADYDKDHCLNHLDTRNSDFLKGAAKLMRDRYNPLAENLQKIKMMHKFSVTMEALTKYHLSLIAEDRIYAQTAIGLGDSSTFNKAYFHLGQIIHEGIENNEKWAQEGNLGEALAILQTVDKGEAAFFRKDIPALQIHQMIHRPFADDYYPVIELAQIVRKGLKNDFFANSLLHSVVINSPSEHMKDFARNGLIHFYDQNLNAVDINPFAHFRDLDVDPMPDLTKPDPGIYGDIFLYIPFKEIRPERVEI